MISMINSFTEVPWSQIVGILILLLRIDELHNIINRYDMSGT